METQLVKVGNKLVASVSNAVATQEALKKVNLSELDQDVVNLIAQQFEGIKGLTELATSQVKTINYFNDLTKKLGNACMNLSHALNEKNQPSNDLTHLNN